MLVIRSVFLFLTRCHGTSSFVSYFVIVTFVTSITKGPHKQTMSTEVSFFTQKRPKVPHTAMVSFGPTTRMTILTCTRPATCSMFQCTIIWRKEDTSVMSQVLPCVDVLNKCRLYPGQIAPKQNTCTITASHMTPLVQMAFSLLPHLWKVPYSSETAVATSFVQHYAPARVSFHACWERMADLMVSIWSLAIWSSGWRSVWRGKRARGFQWDKQCSALAAFQPFLDPDLLDLFDQIL